MELKAYFAILRRRWPLLVIPAVLVLLVGLATYQTPPTVYNVGVNFIVGQAPSSAATTADQERYYNWLTSEYIVNGLTDWVRSGNFAEAVSAQLAQQGVAIPAGAIQGSIAADNTRSMMTLSMTFGDRELLAQMIDAAVVVLKTANSTALPQLGGETAELVQMADPIINAINPGIRQQLDLPLRLAVAIGAGLGLAFLWEYLDPTIRQRQEILALDIPLLGEIPKK